MQPNLLGQLEPTTVTQQTNKTKDGVGDAECRA